MFYLCMHMPCLLFITCLGSAPSHVSQDKIMRLYLRRSALCILIFCIFSFAGLAVLQLLFRWDVYDPMHKLHRQLAMTRDQYLKSLQVPKLSSDTVKTSLVSANKQGLHVDARSHSLKQGFHSNSSLAWPDPSVPWSDRVVEQLHYVPRGYARDSHNLKKIMVGISTSDPMGRDYFLKSHCAVDTCTLSQDIRDAPDADAVVMGMERLGGFKGKTGQIWILYLLEAPTNTGNLGYLGGNINWTATYRRDSTLSTPYEKFVFNHNASLSQLPLQNFAANKTKLVAWFVSNCGSRNRRLQYARELRQYINVDIYGACGEMTCSKYDGNRCFQRLQTQYKFYLSFENSNCHHYITEKFFQNALWNNIVPIVYGARKEDYMAAAPPNSFIYAGDFPSPKQLSEYLWKLDRNDHLYNEYFRWKGMGRFINTKFWCRVCALLHDESRTVRYYEDVEKWWRGENTCTKHSWTNPEDLINWDTFL